MTPEGEGEAAAEMAVAFHNELHSATFPKCANISELARQTRMVIAALEIMNASTMESWEAVILRALEEAFDMGAMSYTPPTEEEMAEVDEALEEGLKEGMAILSKDRTTKVLHQIRAFGVKLDFECALRAHIGFNWCVQARSRCNAHMDRVTRSCLLCGKHEFTYPDVDAPVDRQFFFNFCRAHSVCDGLTYEDPELHDD